MRSITTTAATAEEEVMRVRVLVVAMVASYQLPHQHQEVVKHIIYEEEGQHQTSSRPHALPTFVQPGIISEWLVAAARIL